MSAAAVARDRRSCADCAISRSRACCMRPSRQPLRYRSRSSRARQPSSSCCAIVAQKCSSPGAWVLLVFRLRKLTFAKILDQSPAPMLAAGACWCLRIVICSVAVLSVQPSSPIMPLFNLRPSMIPCSHKPRRTCSAVAFASSVFGVSQLVLHERNGLLEIFLSMCASSAPAPSCRHTRRQQASYTLLLLLCWPSGARGLLHHNHLICTQTLA